MFFGAMSEIMDENADVILTISKTNGHLAVSALSKTHGLKDQAQHLLLPLVVSGTPAELDQGFILALETPLKRSAGLLTNMLEYEQSAEKASKEGRAAKDRQKNAEGGQNPGQSQPDKLAKHAGELEAAGQYRESIAVLKQALLPAGQEEAKKLKEKIASLTTKIMQGNLFLAMDEKKNGENKEAEKPAKAEEPFRGLPAASASVHPAEDPSREYTYNPDDDDDDENEAGVYDDDNDGDSDGDDKQDDTDDSDGDDSYAFGYAESTESYNN